MSRKFSKFNRKIHCLCWGCTPYVENIITTVVLYIQQIALYSKTRIKQYLEYRHMGAGLLTGLSRCPLCLDPLLSPKTPTLTKPINHIAFQTSILNSKHNSQSGYNYDSADILLKLYTWRDC